MPGRWARPFTTWSLATSVSWPKPRSSFSQVSSGFPMSFQLIPVPTTWQLGGLHMKSTSGSMVYFITAHAVIDSDTLQKYWTSRIKSHTGGSLECRVGIDTQLKASSVLQLTPRENSWWWVTLKAKVGKDAKTPQLQQLYLIFHRTSEPFYFAHLNFYLCFSVDEKTEEEK